MRSSSQASPSVAVAGGLDAGFLRTLQSAAHAWAVETRVQAMQTAEDLDDVVGQLDPRTNLILVLAGRWLERHGLELLAEARQCVSGAVTLAVDARLDALSLGHALRYGLRGLVGSTVDTTQLSAALGAMAQGDLWISRKLLAAAVTELLPEHERPQEDVWLGVSTLTERERAVMLHVVDGDPNKVIAQRLGISEQTVKIHLVNVYRKLGVSRRAELIRAVMHAKPAAGAAVA